jgi:hypothetical protein
MGLPIVSRLLSQQATSSVVADRASTAAGLAFLCRFENEETKLSTGSESTAPLALPCVLLGYVS